MDELKTEGLQRKMFILQRGSYQSMINLTSFGFSLKDKRLTYLTYISDCLHSPLE